MCVVPENSHTSSQRATEILREGRGPKDGDFQGGGDAYSGFFFPVVLSKIGELLINNSFSDEQAISYFTVYTGVSKQVLLFTLTIFYL